MLTMAEYIDKEIALSLVQPDTPEDEKSAITIATAKKLVRSIVYRTPTADVAPVRHGHWNTGYFHDRVCSCCLHPDNDINDYAHSYCPNCGAKMDEEINDDQ